MNAKKILNLAQEVVPKVDRKVAQNGHVVQVIDVIKSFPLGGGEITILKGISFDVGRGEFVSIVGPSGNGKTTIAEQVAGNLYPCRFGISKTHDPLKGSQHSVCQVVGNGPCKKQ